MRKRVLVCEDDGAIRLLLGKLLTRHGLSADCVATGAEAAQRLRREFYDLILLDLLTPGMSGFEVLDLLGRERPYLLDRVIVITALQRVFHENLPVAAILRKPFDIPEFDWTVEHVLRRTSPRDREARVEGHLR